MYFLTLYLLFVARQQFFDIVSKETQDQFKTSIDKLLKHLAPPGGNVVDDTVRGLFFGDYMIQGADPRIYNEVTDFAELTTTIERWVGQWVWSSKGVWSVDGAGHVFVCYCF